MTLDFRQVQEQVKKIGESAPRRLQHLKQLHDQAVILLAENALEFESLHRKAERAHQSDPSLRCALPVSEPLSGCYPLPDLPPAVVLIAADGSQINPNRHGQVEYCLINVGAIRIKNGDDSPPSTVIRSHLFYDDQLYTSTGTMTENSLALARDLNERIILAELAEEEEPPVLAFMDGQMELWGTGMMEGALSEEFKKSLDIYKDNLKKLCSHGVATCGYIDKPAADLVVRLLEIAATPDNEIENLHHSRPLRGVRDRDLFRDLLPPGERSAVFGIQSRLASFYRDELALHFFYLNVGRAGRPWLVRVEVPAWVALDEKQLNMLHAVLVQQCRVMGSRPYPYLLHRAHETAVVTLPEQEQVSEMITNELLRKGVEIGEGSYKQAAKDLAGRTRYEG